MTTTAITLTHQGRSFQFRQDGWFNMTTAAQSFGKRLQDFMDNADTRQYMGELSLLSRETHANQRVFVQAITGRNGGTWAHPKLAVFFARWLDVRFAVWCDMQRLGIFPR